MIRKTKEYLKHGDDVIPTVAGLACHLDVSKYTIYRWIEAGVSDEFSDLLSKLDTTQERMLIQGGLKGGFNAAITKLLLSKHGYSDNQQSQAAITVNVSRDKVDIKHKNQTLTIDQTD